MYIEKVDQELWDAMQKEAARQIEKIELIASENFTSDAVREAAGSVLTHKYAEGYPAKRYYGGCEFVDIAEELAIQRAKEIFGCDHVNVQPHSGSQANMGVYLSVLEPGDTILGMSLSHGGHLTHGHPVNFSGRLYNIVAYQVNEDSETLDYEAIRKLALESKPKMIVCGASAYARTIHFDKFREIADEVGAYLMADIAHIAGLVATGLHPDPIPYCDFVTTTTHKTLRGTRGGMIMCKEKYAKAVNRTIFPGIQGGPLMHIIAAKAVAFKEALRPEFKTYQSQVLKNAKVLAKALQDKGLRIVSDGTDNHLMLLDVSVLGCTGKEIEKALDLAGITVNKNTIPFDKQSPFVTSGIRIGTPAATTRGMKEDAMEKIAQWIADAIKNKDDEDALAAIALEVKEFASKYPLFTWE